MADEQELLDLADRWAKYYNEDCDRMVYEVYAPDFKAYPMAMDLCVEGQDNLKTLEDAMIDAAPKRRIDIARKHVSGDVVVVEAFMRDADKGDDWEIPFVVVLTVRDGKVIIDRTYAHWNEWPGFKPAWAKLS